MVKNEKAGKTAGKLLCFALLAEAFITADILVGFVVAAMTDDVTVQRLLGWVIVYVLWGAGILLVARGSKPLRRYGYTAKPQWVVFALAAGASVLLSAVAWGGVKPYIEITGAMNGLGVGLGLVAFLLQYIYYALEAALMLLILACGQRAGEELCGRGRIPYGSLVLAVLWGLPHLYTQGLGDGLLVILAALLYGVAYNAVKGEKRLVYPLLFVLSVF